MSNERSRRRCLLREIYAAITRQVSVNTWTHLTLTSFSPDFYQAPIGSQACSVHDICHGKFAGRFAYVMLKLFIQF